MVLDLETCLLRNWTVDWVSFQYFCNLVISLTLKRHRRDFVRVSSFLNLIVLLVCFTGLQK